MRCKTQGRIFEDVQWLHVFLSVTDVLPISEVQTSMDIDVVDSQYD